MEKMIQTFFEKVADSLFTLPTASAG